MVSLDELDPDKLLDEPSYFVEHYIGVEPYHYQKEFMDHPSRRKAFVSGRRVGKSRTASWLALWYAVTHENRDVLITANTQRQSSELFNQIKKEVRHSKASEEMWGVGRSTRTTMNFSNGCRIKCLPVGRDGSNIRGFGADLLIVDEAAFIKDQIFKEVLAPMLAGPGRSYFMLLSTPLDESGYLYQRWDDCLDDDEPWFGMQVPTTENPDLEDDFVEKQREHLSHSQFKREYLGKFDESSTSFFMKQELMNCAHKPEDVEEGTWSVNRGRSEPAFLGVDLAGSGSDESAFVSVDGTGNVFDVRSDNMSLSDSMREVGKLHQQHSYNKILVDATGLGEGPVEEMQGEIGRVVDGFKFTNEKKQSLYNTLKNHFQRGDLSYEFVPNKKEAENKLVEQALALEYSYTSTGKIKIEHPPNGHDDLTDALALAVWAKSQKNFARSDKGSMKPFTLGSLTE